jgi:hypothetical protein
MSRTRRFYELGKRLTLIALVTGAAPVFAVGMIDVQPFLSFSEIMKLGRSLVMDRIPEQSRQSLPVPVRASEGFHVAFLYSPSQALPNETRLAPPHFVALLDPVTGKLAGVRHVTPQTFGQAHEPDALIGTFKLAPGTDYKEYLAERERLFRLYERLVPEWAGHASTARQDLRPLAAEFLRLFSLLSEPPLEPYYNSLGAEFFAWVRAIAR